MNLNWIFADPCFLHQIDHLAKSKHVSLAQFECWRIYFIATHIFFFFIPCVSYLFKQLVLHYSYFIYFVMFSQDVLIICLFSILRKYGFGRQMRN